MKWNHKTQRQFVFTFFPPIFLTYFLSLAVYWTPRIRSRWAPKQERVQRRNWDAHVGSGTRSMFIKRQVRLLVVTDEGRLLTWVDAVSAKCVCGYVTLAEIGFHVTTQELEQRGVLKGHAGTQDSTKIPVWLCWLKRRSYQERAPASRGEEKGVQDWRKDSTGGKDKTWNQT